MAINDLIFGTVYKVKIYSVDLAKMDPDTVLRNGTADVADRDETRKLIDGDDFTVSRRDEARIPAEMLFDSLGLGKRRLPNMAEIRVELGITLPNEDYGLPVEIAAPIGPFYFESGAMNYDAFKDLKKYDMLVDQSKSWTDLRMRLWDEIDIFDPVLPDGFYDRLVAKVCKMNPLLAAAGVLGAREYGVKVHECKYVGEDYRSKKLTKVPGSPHELRDTPKSTWHLCADVCPTEIPDEGIIRVEGDVEVGRMHYITLHKVEERINYKGYWDITFLSGVEYPTARKVEDPVGHRNFRNRMINRIYSNLSEEMYSRLIRKY